MVPDLAPFTASGIGSLPYASAEQAVDLITRYLPQAPHWPQLPQRGHQENFIYQFLSVLVRQGLLVNAGHDRTIFDTSRDDLPDRMAAFYDLYLRVESGETALLASFAPDNHAAPGFYTFLKRLREEGVGGKKCLKGQVSGPLSVTLTIHDQEGKAAFYNEQLRDVIVKALSLSCRWQVEELSSFGLPVMLFVDDPAVAAIGSSTYVTITEEQGIEVLGELAASISQAGALPGVHSCAGVDWTLFIKAGYKVLAFDAYGYFESLLPYARELAAFLDEGGYLAWGVVPTSEEVDGESVASLKEKFIIQRNELERRGVPSRLLDTRVLVTPSCGTGTLTVERAERIYRLTSELSVLLKGMTSF